MFWLKPLQSAFRHRQTDNSSYYDRRITDLKVHDKNSCTADSLVKFALQQ